MTGLVEREVDERGIVALTLNRPASRNSLSLSLLTELEEAIGAAAADGTVGAIVLRGAGPVFCAGADLEEVGRGGRTVEALLMRLSQVLRRLARAPVPTVAVVRGAAIGGGFGLVCASDFSITHAEAKVGYPPVETGLSPAVMAPYLVRLIGAGRAGAMLLRGGTISGREAQARGIVTELSEARHLEGAAERLAGSLIGGDREGTAQMKRLLHRLSDALTDDVLDDAARVSAEVVSGDAAQGRLGGGRAGD